MIVKNTLMDYSCTVMHHADLGFIFVGRAQRSEDPKASRWIYPVMVINTGECFDMKPTELIGSLILDNMYIGYKGERLPR